MPGIAREHKQRGGWVNAQSVQAAFHCGLPIARKLTIRGHLAVNLWRCSIRALRRNSETSRSRPRTRWLPHRRAHLALATAKTKRARGRLERKRRSQALSMHSRARCALAKSGSGLRGVLVCCALVGASASEQALGVRLFRAGVSQVGTFASPRSQRKYAATSMKMMGRFEFGHVCFLITAPDALRPFSLDLLSCHRSEPAVATSGNR